MLKKRERKGTQFKTPFFASPMATRIQWLPFRAAQTWNFLIITGVDSTSQQMLNLPLSSTFQTLLRIYFNISLADSHLSFSIELIYYQLHQNLSGLCSPPGSLPIPDWIAQTLGVCCVVLATQHLLDTTEDSHSVVLVPACLV